MAKRGEFPSDKADQFLFRFPDNMRDRVKQSAKANHRSMNAEIAMRLQSTFEPEPATDDAESITAAIHALVDRLARINKAS